MATEETQEPKAPETPETAPEGANTPEETTPAAPDKPKNRSRGAKAPKEEGLSEKMDKVISILGRFDERLSDVEQKMEQSPDIRMAKLKDQEEERNKQMKRTGRRNEEQDDLIEINVAPGFIEDLHSILGEKYGVSIQQSRYGTTFLATIFVPRDHSSLSEDEWSVRKCDPRSKMIPAANAVQGFREWCYKVKQNVARNLQDAPLRPLHDTDNQVKG